VNNLPATVKAPLELSNWTEQIRSFSNPNQTSSGFQIAPIAKCNRKRVFSDATTLRALAKQAGYDAERDKNGKPSRTDVDSVSNAAIGEYEQSLQKEKIEDDKIKQCSFSGCMHTDGVSMSLHTDVVDSEDEEEQTKSRQTDSNCYGINEPPGFLWILEGSAQLQ